jgi:hypothetical protein
VLTAVLKEIAGGESGYVEGEEAILGLDPDGAFRLAGVSSPSGVVLP